jgi:hypothetical protein
MFSMIFSLLKKFLPVRTNRFKDIMAGQTGQSSVGCKKLMVPVTPVRQLFFATWANNCLTDMTGTIETCNRWLKIYNNIS